VVLLRNQFTLPLKCAGATVLLRIVAIEIGGSQGHIVAFHYTHRAPKCIACREGKIRPLRGEKEANAAYACVIVPVPMEAH
jgi:hypothetical protein